VARLGAVVGFAVVGFSVASVALLASCGAPDPEQTGFVVLDDRARQAGLAVEVSGETQASSLPIAVDARDDVAIVGPERRTPLLIAPGEVVEVSGAEGAIHRGRALRDAVVLEGSAQDVDALAGMLGANTQPLGRGRYRLSAPDVLLALSLFRDAPGIVAARALIDERAQVGSAWMPASRGVPGGASDAVAAVGFAESARTEQAELSAAGRTIEPVMVVGKYRAGAATLVLDACGGYVLRAGRRVERGAFSVRAARVELVRAEDGVRTSLVVGDDAAWLGEPVTGLSFEFESGEPS